MPFTPLAQTIGFTSPPLPVALGGTGASSAAAGLASLGGLGLQASVALGGFALQNGTPNIATWTPPNDGALHRVVIIVTLHVTLAETGGAIGATITKPDGSPSTPALDPGGHAAGGQFFIAGYHVQAGQPVTVAQTAALTAGAALAWVDIWGI